MIIIEVEGQYMNPDKIVYVGNTTSPGESFVVLEGFDKNIFFSMDSTAVVSKIRAAVRTQG